MCDEGAGLVAVIIVSILNKHLAFESIFADCEHGFRSQRPCEIQLGQFYSDMVRKLYALNRGHKQTDVIIMMFRNNVRHKRILYNVN